MRAIQLAGERTARRVILVDERDAPIGESEKLATHRLGNLHRAFSVLLFGEPGVLLQQRARDKYHSAFLWSNACCGHPSPGEITGVAAGRRLREEMGLGSPLREVLRLQYRLHLGGGLIEHELNHVFVGWTSETPRPDSAEVADWRWIPPELLNQDLGRNPHIYSAWLPLVWDAVIRWNRNADCREFEPRIRRVFRELGGLQPDSA